MSHSETYNRLDFDDISFNINF